MPRVPNPDFRYVWLEPVLAPRPVMPLAIASGTCISLAGTLGFSAHDAGFGAVALIVAVEIGAACAFGGILALGARARQRGAPMAIVPWGVVVDPERAPRALRWPALSRVEIETQCDIRGGTPMIISSRVTISTEREVFRGRAPGAVGLELLSVHLPAWTAEAVRPVARDLDGTEPAGDGATEPIFSELFREAAELCSSSRGAARLCLLPGGYRRMSLRVATPETTTLLSAVLDAPTRGRCADPRPLAAILAGMLDARGTLPVLLRLTSAPHPVTAAAARAAALRLGVPANKTGAIEELDPFLADEDVEMLRAWSEAPDSRAFLANPTPVLLTTS